MYTDSTVCILIDWSYWAVRGPIIQEFFPRGFRDIFNQRLPEGGGGPRNIFGDFTL